MAEDVARAVGAGTTEGISIAGKICKVRPLTIKELTELERECLSKYRRSFVQTFAENADLLGPVDGPKLVREKLEEASRFDISSLPKKDIFDPKRIKINDRIEKWIEQNISGYETPPEGKRETLHKRIVATALDNGDMSVELYENLTGTVPYARKEGYVSWWVTATFDGQMAMIYQAFRDSGVTRDEIASEIGKNPQILIDLAREIEHLSAPEVGNG